MLRRLKVTKMKANKWYKTVNKIQGPLIILKKVENVSYGEICKIKTGNNTISGRVIDVSKDKAVVQIFGENTGLNLDSKVKFEGKPFTLKVSKDMLGRVMNGMGEVIEGKKYVAEKELDINGSPINPASRRPPQNFIETGVSSIDVMIPLVMGQKLPIFTSAGLPHNELAVNILKNSKVEGKKFVKIFAAMGVTNEEARFFKREFSKSSKDDSIMIINTADDSSVERIMTPRIALTTAEYLAYEHDYDVVVILTDMTNYCESLREISSARSEVPGRRGYPGYMYTDLAMLYERAGRVEGSKGTVTQIPILTMPGGDKTHPVPDLTGYITEGQISLDKNLNNKGINPPINPLNSLSRLKNNIDAKEKTREDHMKLADQLYACYAQAIELRQLVSVIGEEALTKVEQTYLSFAKIFENEFLHNQQRRTIQESLDIGWKALSKIPSKEYKKISEKLTKKYQNE